MTRLALLVTTAALALVPATALAQSAGDDQYSDPLGQTKTSSTGTRTTTPPPTTTTPSSGSGAGTAAGTTTGSGTAAPATTAAAGTTAASDGKKATGLARTGGEPLLVALAGVLLVLLGIGLRLRTADARR